MFTKKMMQSRSKVDQRFINVFRMRQAEHEGYKIGLQGFKSDEQEKENNKKALLAKQTASRDKVMLKTFDARNGGDELIYELDSDHPIQE